MTATKPPADYSDLNALYINCTLKRSPELSHTQGLMDRSIALMRKQGVTVDAIRFIDHGIATGVYPDMREHGWDEDGWPDDVWPRVQKADILVVGGPLWLGDNASVTRQLIERLYAMSGLFNDKGQYVYYGKTAGALITGNEDGVKHAAMSTLYSLQHIGYTIPPAADAGWIGEVGPGPSYLDPGSGGPGERLHQPQHHVHDLEPHAHGPDAEGRRRDPRVRQSTTRLERRRALGLRRQPRVPLSS